MQNTSPGPEGKEREGKRGKEGRGLNMNADTSRAGLLSAGFQSWRQGTCLTERTSRVFTKPLLAGAEATAHSNTERNKGSLRCSIWEAELSTWRAGRKLPSALLCS